MYIAPKTHTEKRVEFRKALETGKCLRFPGAYNALVAKLIEKLGFDGIYVSGGVMANSLGLPDIGLTTLDEVKTFASNIAKVSTLPTIMDVDTGFGEPVNTGRTIAEIEYLGLTGCHLEDQINPKRCGHLDGKQLVSKAAMCHKIKAAADSKADDNFLIIARTDARAIEGLDYAIDRAKAYVDSGAEMIFPEALQDEREFERFRKALPDTYLLANMTEFGKSKLLSYQQLTELGFNLVIYPVTTQRIAMYAVEEGLKHILNEGSQEALVDKMQTRKRLYEVVDYEKFAKFDESIFNFKLED